jgi:hypothetical protein
LASMEKWERYERRGIRKYFVGPLRKIIAEKPIDLLAMHVQRVGFHFGQERKIV